MRAPNEKIRLLLMAAIVSVVTLAVYLPALRNGFVEWDDNLYVYDNPLIRSLDLKLLAGAFSPFADGNWFPVTLLSHALDYAVWGLDPFGHHLTSILLHAVNTFLVVLLAAKVLTAFTSEPDSDESAAAFLGDRRILIAAAGTGALFGLHPLHVESVAWVSERKDLLCGLFYLLSISSYLNYTAGAGDDFGRQGGASFLTDRRYLAVLGWFLLALMSKPMAVSLPFVLLLLDWHPLRRLASAGTIWRALREKLPFIVASLAVSLITFLAQRTAGSMEYMDQLPIGTRMAVAAKALIAYLVNMVYPADLSPYYPYPRIVSFTSPEYLLPVAAVIGLFAGSIALARSRPVWPAAWGFYVITLLPVLGIVQVGGQAMADRYTYLPSLAPFLLCSLGVAWVAAGARYPGWLRGLVAAIAVCTIIAFSALTVRQTGIWKDGIVLWTYIIEKDTAHAPLPFLNRGAAYLKAGDRQNAVTDFSTAIELNPGYVKALYARGSEYRAAGNLDRAIEDYTRVLAIDPGFREALLGRAASYDAKGMTGPAIDDMGSALELDPRDAVLHIQRGMALKKAGAFDQAIDEYTEAIALEPARSEAYNNRGVAWKNLGRLDRAVADYSRAIELDPQFSLAYCNRGIVLGMLGRSDAAIEDYSRALELQPDLDKALLERGRLYARAGRRSLAKQDLWQACDRSIAEACFELRSLAGQGQ